VIHDAHNRHVDAAQYSPNNEIWAMEIPAAEQQDGLSDYGSDFTPDEEEILKSLLQQGPQEPDNPITDPDLDFKDVEDEATPKGARVRQLGYESRLLPTPTKEEKTLTAQRISGIVSVTNGMLSVPWINSTD